MKLKSLEIIESGRKNSFDDTTGSDDYDIIRKISLRAADAIAEEDLYLKDLALTYFNTALSNEDQTNVNLNRLWTWHDLKVILNNAMSIKYA